MLDTKSETNVSEHRQFGLYSSSADTTQPMIARFLKSIVKIASIFERGRASVQHVKLRQCLVDGHSLSPLILGFEILI